jgi:hypothetical protein
MERPEPVQPRLEEVILRLSREDCLKVLALATAQLASHVGPLAAISALNTMRFNLAKQNWPRIMRKIRG